MLSCARIYHAKRAEIMLVIVVALALLALLALLLLLHFVTILILIAVTAAFTTAACFGIFVDVYFPLFSVS